MEEKLLQRFGQEFKPLDRVVKEEELLIFLDKNGKAKFDRDVFKELALRTENRYGVLTPNSFARTYCEAVETLKRKTEHTMTDINKIDYSIQLAKKEPMSRIDLDGLILHNPSTASNFVTIDVTRNCSLNFYNLKNEHDFLFVPKSLITRNEPMRVTLQNLHSHIVDSKNLDVQQEIKKQKSEVPFSDGSALTMIMSVDDVSRKECLEFLYSRKNELQEYQVHTRTKSAVLIETFPEIFSGTIDIRQSQAACSCLFITTCVLTFIMLILALFLNGTRCMFIDIFVAFSFFGNAYIWRNFNVFLSIRLIGVLVVSILLDIVWEIIKIANYNQYYETTVRWMRISGFVLVGVLFLIKCVLLYLYFKVSKEDHLHGYLGLNDEISVNEVSPDDYLAKAAP